MTLCVRSPKYANVFEVNPLPQIVTSMVKCEVPKALVAWQAYLPASSDAAFPIRNFEVTRSNSRISVVLDFPGKVKYSWPSFDHLMLQRKKKRCRPHYFRKAFLLSAMSFLKFWTKRKNDSLAFFSFQNPRKSLESFLFWKKWLGKKKKVSSNLQMIIKFCYCSLFSFDVVGGLNSLLYRALCKLIKLIYYIWLSTACFNSSFWCGWVSRRFEKVWQDEKEFETKILFALLVRRRRTH